VGWEYWRGVRARLRSSGEAPWVALSRLVSRARPRYGGYLVHLGVAVIAVGIISSQLYQVQREVTLPIGGSVTVGRYKITSLGLVETQGPRGRVDTARLQVSEEGGA